MNEDVVASKRVISEMNQSLLQIRETTDSPRVEKAVQSSLVQCQAMLDRLDQFSLDEEETDDDDMMCGCF